MNFKQSFGKDWIKTAHLNICFQDRCKSIKLSRMYKNANNGELGCDECVKRLKGEVISIKFIKQKSIIVKHFI